MEQAVLHVGITDNWPCNQLGKEGEVKSKRKKPWTFGDGTASDITKIANCLKGIETDSDWQCIGGSPFVVEQDCNQEENA